MGYQALLFCPDERTARTLTQVLSELEFNVEASTEPFAAVKKLMGQHFDAVVVDCDNEQNATLLFKSARNSTSNQSSLAVAVVEGQAGVAKAFRIGANLVLTKPINIEQAKGTLRVARGLLRKGEPAKPAAPAPSATESAVAPAAAKPAPKPAPRPTPTTLSAAAPARAVVKPSPSAAPAQSAAAASSAASTHNTDLPEIKSKPVAPPAPKTAMPAVPPKPAAPAVPAAEAKPAIQSSTPFSAPTLGAAASAPAPAREPDAADVATAAPTTATEAPAEKPAEASAPSVPIGAEPSFTFGGANVAEAGGGSKKIFLAVAAAVLVAAGLYTGWTYYQGHRSHAVSPIPAPVATPQPVKPAAVPTATPPTASATTPPQPATPTAADTSSTATSTAPSAESPTSDSADSADEDNPPAPTSARKPTSAQPQSGKAAPATKSASAPVAAPLVVKGGAVPKIKTKADADADAPSLMAAAGAGAPPPSILGSEGPAPKPILQAVNVSQGVSQGLLYKKVAPVYPRNALNMNIEGTVELQATISKTGDITKIKVLSGDPQLAKAASDAVKQWKYKPYLLNGEPVEITTEVTINFKLPK